MSAAHPSFRCLALSAAVAVISCGFRAGAEEESKAADGPRRYSGYINVHHSPDLQSLPEEEPRGAGDYQSDPGGSSRGDTTAIGDTLRGAVPAARPARKEADSDNWLAPTDWQDEIDSSLGGTKEEGPSGWGWLHDEILSAEKQSQTQEADATSNGDGEAPDDANSPAEPLPAPSTAPAPPAAGTFAPLVSSPVVARPRDEAASRSAEAERAEPLLRDAGWPAGDRSGREEREETYTQETVGKFNSDERWGSERHWAARGQEPGVSGLPQTESLLSAINDPLRSSLSPSALLGHAAPGGRQEIPPPETPRPTGFPRGEPAFSGLAGLSPVSGRMPDNSALGSPRNGLGADPLQQPGSSWSGLGQSAYPGVGPEKSSVLQPQRPVGALKPIDDFTTPAEPTGGVSPAWR